ncbi:MAG: FAD-dependent oxidoreductase [Clostridia bacterium]
MELQHVWQPIRLADLELPNRVMMGSMHVAIKTANGGINRIARFYAERARGGVGLIVTGGVGISPEGGLGQDDLNIYSDEHIELLRPIPEAVHQVGGRIALQLFHAGRYAYQEVTGLLPVAPSPLQAPINRTAPRELSAAEIEQTIQQFVDGAIRARQAGFDAVEIMGSEGYLINQFLSPVTNCRADEWGGDFANRTRFGVEVARRVRKAVGQDFPVIFRMSGLDLMPESTTMDETIEFARMLEEAGVNALNIGIGWHESKVPTIAMMVPRGSYAWVARQIKEAVRIPVVASNRINDVRLAEQILFEGMCDMVSMARPFLADPDILRKAGEGRLDEVNTCIACNQACLDHVFDHKEVSCLVNPQAGRERELEIVPAPASKRVAVVGAGPAGLEAARVLAERGHQVTIFERRSQLGGQLNYAKKVPGKQEFNETLRYYQVQLDRLGVTLKLGVEVSASQLLEAAFDEVVVATGVQARKPDLKGIDLPHVVSYQDVFEQKALVGKRVAIIGAGGIACDLSHLLAHNGSITSDVAHYLQEHQVLSPKQLARNEHSGRSITLMRRGKHVGSGLGKTTRWAVLAQLAKQGVKMMTGIDYVEITEAGVMYQEKGESKLLEADTVIVAAGQTPNNQLYEELKGKVPVHVIGGAREAGELDAKRAILEGTMVGRSI